MNPRRLLLLSLIAAGSLMPQSYIITTVAGTDRLRDGSPAATAPLRLPNGVVADSRGNLYISDRVDSRVRKVGPDGAIGTFAGSGLPGFSGDGGPASSARLDEPAGLAMDAQGNVYIADRGNNCIRKVSPAGVISTPAGNGNFVFGGDGGPATAAQFDPLAVAVDAAGNLYISDAANSRIRKVNAQGIISTIAGTGTMGYSGDGGRGASAQISMATSLAVDAANNLYIADYFNNRIRKLTPDGTITTVAGNGNFRFNGDNIPASTAAMDPIAVAVDAGGNLYIADALNNRVRAVDAATGAIRTIAGNGSFGFAGDGAAATAAMLATPWALYVDTVGATLTIVDLENCRVRQVSSRGTITTVAGAAVGDGAVATNGFLNLPTAVAVDPAGHLYVADSMHHRIRKVTAAGAMFTLAGSGFAGYTDSAAAAGARFNTPMGVALDAAGNVYVADSDNFAIRKITPAGAVSTLAGTGQRGFSGDGAGATLAQIGMPTSVVVDAAGNVYFNDLSFNHIRKVTPQGIIGTVAGNGNPQYAGDNGPAIAAQLQPFDLALDGAGNLLIADQGNHRVRKIDARGVITTVAGNGALGHSGDAGPATAARLAAPSGVAVDAQGNLYIGEHAGATLRRVTPSGVISTIAGTGDALFAGDGGPATAAQLDPFRLAVDSSGNLYVADFINDRIRKLRLLVPARLSIAGGNSQTATTGAAFALPLTVQVLDGAGVPVPGVTVVFTLTSGSATLSAASAVTASDGTAATRVTPDAPGAILVTASVSGLTVATFQLTARAGAPVPRISAGGVVGAGLSVPPVRALSPNAIASAFGENFTAGGPLRRVDAADLVEGRLPTNFAGVCVLVGGVPAPIFAVLANQVNFQVPRLPAAETVPVQVVSNCGAAGEVRSAAESVRVQAATPEFFYFLQRNDGRNPIAAVNAFTGVYVGAPDLLAGAVFVPARPGDTLTLYLTGLGATDPSYAPGVLPEAAGNVTAAPAVRIGGRDLAAADLLYAGVAPLNAGLYQLNLRVPSDLPDGDQPVVVTVGGLSSPPGAFITVRR